jgi:mycothiol system anti-sigma-R factor
MTSLGPLTPCHEVVALLWEYLDDELDAAGRQRIREHLDECKHCEDHFTFEGAFLRSVAKVLDEPIDVSGLRSRIVETLRTEGHDRTP